MLPPLFDRFGVHKKNPRIGDFTAMSNNDIICADVAVGGQSPLSHSKFN